MPDETSRITRIGSAVVIAGDCVAVMQTLAPGRIEHIVTDPPYGLEFMGKAFDKLGKAARQQEWHARWLHEAHRVLDDDGTIRAFGGTRTFHRLCAAMHDAGFTNLGLEAWLYGSGFPKSHNISKALDKLAGAEREVVGYKAGVGGENMNDIVHGREVRTHEDEGGKGMGAYGIGAKQVRIQIPVTAPATDEAARWEGWGTALKPAWEPIVVASKGAPVAPFTGRVIHLLRKPLAGTVAANVVKYGCGGLNIDAGRIGYVSDADKASATPQGKCTSHDSTSIGAKPNVGQSVTREEFVRPEQQGRWPANVIPLPESALALGGPARYFYNAPTSIDAIAYLAGMIQVGELNRGWSHIGWTEDYATLLDDLLPGAHVLAVSDPERDPLGWRAACAAEDAGFEIRDAILVLDDVDMARYCPKAAKSERERGCEGLASDGKRGNSHPTVKPVKAIRWLIERTEYTGVVLDPFAGSGTTLVAAIEGGRAAIGIERADEYVPIIHARVSAATRTSRP